MNKVAVAKEMLKLAKRLTASKKNADYGDIPLYLNLFQIFTVPSDIPDAVMVKLLQGVGVVASSVFYNDSQRAIIRALKSNSGIQRLIEENGIEFK